MTVLSIKFYEHDQDVYGITIINRELNYKYLSQIRSDIQPFFHKISNTCIKFPKHCYTIPVLSLTNIDYN